MSPEEKLSLERQAAARFAVLLSALAAFVVIGIAVALDGLGPLWSNDSRWFCAGLSCAALVVNIVALREWRRVGERERQARASMERLAGEFADAVKRELAKRGIEGEVEGGVGLPPSLRPRRMH